MAQYYDEPDYTDDGAFVTIRFNDILEPNHEARYIKKFVDGIDVTDFEKRYKVGGGESGRPPKGIKMMLGIILYAIYKRIYSAHQIEKASYSYADFWIFTHKKRVSHDKISDFVNMHKEEMKPVFLETILLAEKNRLLSFRTLYQDGFQIKANASRKRNRSKGKLKERKKKIEKKLEEILTKMQESDKGDGEVSREQRKMEKELKEIEGLQEELNKKIRLRTFAKLPKEAKAIEEKMQINSTDRDAEIMKMKNGSYENAYTKINGVDGKADIIVASDVDGHYDESHKVRKITKKANENCKGLGGYRQVCADSNFNTLGSCVSLEAEGMELISPTKEHERQRKNPEKYKGGIKFEYDEGKNRFKCTEGNILEQKVQSVKVKHGSRIMLYSNEEGCGRCKRKKECTRSEYRVVRIDARYVVQQRAYERYKSEEGQKLYKKRIHIAEVFQADLKQNGNFIQLLRRGLEKVKIDLMLQDIVWNLRRIINATKGNIVWAT